MPERNGNVTDLRQWIVAPAYVAWLPIAVAGAALDWSPWVILALLSPGVAWYAATEGVRCYSEARLRNPNASVPERLPILYPSTLFAVAIVFPNRFTGVLIVIAFALTDLGSWWRRRRHVPAKAPESPLTKI